MSGTVGSKGQVVIEKSIRNRLGIEQGTHTIQKVVDDHVEIYFLPNRGKGSLQGILAHHIKAKYSTEEELRNAIEDIWVEENNAPP